MVCCVASHAQNPILHEVRQAQIRLITDAQIVPTWNSGARVGACRTLGDSWAPRSRATSHETSTNHELENKRPTSCIEKSSEFQASLCHAPSCSMTHPGAGQWTLRRCNRSKNLSSHICHSSLLCATSCQGVSVIASIVAWMAASPRRPGPLSRCRIPGGALANRWWGAASPARSPPSRCDGNIPLAAYRLLATRFLRTWRSAAHMRATPRLVVARTVPHSVSSGAEDREPKRRPGRLQLGADAACQGPLLFLGMERRPSRPYDGLAFEIVSAVHLC